MTKDTVLFHALTAVTMIVFAWGVYEHVAFWFKGRIEGREGASAGEKVSYVWGLVGKALSMGETYKTLLLSVILQWQVLRENWVRWLMHVSLMWGFAGLFFIGSLGNMAMDLHLVNFTKDTLWFAVVNDLFGVLLLVGAVVAVARRYIQRLPQLKSNLDDVIVMSSMGVLVFSGFGLEIARLNMEGVPETWARYSFIAQWGRQFLPAYLDWARLHLGVWWFHMALGFALVMYIPHSKLFHLFVSPLSLLAYSLSHGKTSNRKERTYGL